VLYQKNLGSKPRPWWAEKSLFLKVGKNPTPSVGLELIANCEWAKKRIGFIYLKYAGA
jgi:hypothetical protein